MTKKLRGISKIPKETALGDEAIPKSISMEAEFYWALKHQTSRLTLELADFCEAHAKILDLDASYCCAAAESLRPTLKVDT